MNCVKCASEIEIKHDSLKCRGICGKHFHLSCLSNANKAYKKSLITALINIENLLWLCDDCLPNITDTFSSHGVDTQQNEHNQTMQTNQSLENLVSISSHDSIRSEHAIVTQNAHTNGQPSNSLADLVASTSTGSTNSVQQDGSIPMAIDDNATESMDVTEGNAKKRRRPNDNDNAAECSIPSATAAPKFTSTNYRCIYLTSFKPSTNESDIIQYVVTKKREATEIMECKKLLPAKCNMNKISFISFKLTVHKEFFDVYMDPTLWPNGVKAEEFVLRPPKKTSNCPQITIKSIRCSKTITNSADTKSTQTNDAHVFEWPGFTFTTQPT